MTTTEADINSLNDAELDAEIARLEQKERYFDAAEGQQWFREMAAREANERRLDALRALRCLPTT